jgi:hypothetical protein
MNDSTPGDSAFLRASFNFMLELSAEEWLFQREQMGSWFHFTIVESQEDRSGTFQRFQLSAR